MQSFADIFITKEMAERESLDSRIFENIVLLGKSVLCDRDIYICATIPVIVYTCNKHKAWTDIDIIFIFDQACCYDTTLFRWRRIVWSRITLPRVNSLIYADICTPCMKLSSNYPRTRRIFYIL